MDFPGRGGYIKDVVLLLSFYDAHLPFDGFGDYRFHPEVRGWSGAETTK